MLSPRPLVPVLGAFAVACLFGCLNPSDSSDNALALSQAAAADSAAKAEKRDVCHIPPGNPENAHTISIGSPAVVAHLAHGDKLGRCEDVVIDPPKHPCADGSSRKKGIAPDLSGHKAKVCHIPPGNPENRHTIEVGIAAVKAHLAHGDSLGACVPEGTGESAVPDCVKGPGKSGDKGVGKGGGKVDGPIDPPADSTDGGSV